MIEPFLKSELEPVARRRRRWNLGRDLLVCWAAIAVLAFLFVLVYRETGWLGRLVFPVLLAGCGVGALLVWIRSRRWEPDYREIARQIEQQHPELHALLLTAVEQRPDPTTGQLNYLQERVVREAIAQGVDSRWVDTVSNQRLAAVYALQIPALLLLGYALAGLHVHTKEAVALAQPTRVSVNPGDTTVERGNGLAILARFEGPLPPDVTLVLRPDGQPEQRVPMSKSLNDPVFGATLASVTNRLTYSVDYSGGHSQNYQVSVFEFPRLERADAHLQFPTYTGLPEKRIEDTRRVSAVEGSTLDLALQLNKPVRSATLISKAKKVIPLSATAGHANAELSHFPLQQSDTYQLELVDADGRTNKVPAQIIVEVFTNRVPELKIISPHGDQRVSPIEEISFQGEASDDFGLKGYGITYAVAGGKSQSISLGGGVAGRQKQTFQHVLPMESLGAEPDQLLSYFVWADDIGPDGKVRRTASDMFYAEVRPFEEIFRERQGQSRSQESEQQGQQSETQQLVELQKQILNATWKLQREAQVGLPTDSGQPQKPSMANLPPTYGKDIQVVEQSQKAALTQAKSKRSQEDNPRTKALWENVEKAMGQSAGHLADAGKAPDRLPNAVESEQAAYQALLKLAAHEHNVSRGQRGNRGSMSQSMQRELDNLDLKQTENKYENERQAAAKQNPQQREQQQILSRLKELAQRQQDLNQRLKELQTALQEAKTDREREDIQRQLKRLREQEQQMLADVDELAQRMDRPENQSRMADSRQQLEKTRNQVQRASEMMQQQSLGQALSAGTRAQRELQDLRDDFRKKNSAQFAEEMRQMRSDARDLAQQEEKIGDKLQALAEPKRKSLSDSDQTKQLSEQFAKQSQKMTNLLEQMAQVSQESETAEPLLSKQLYDTLRKASQTNPGEALKRADQLQKLSFFDQAAQSEQRARQDINQVKQGVERAAESVLGDETEALRLARSELDDLMHQVQNEMDQPGTNSMARARPGQQGQRNANASGNKSQAGAGQASPNEQQLAQADPSQSGQQNDAQAPGQQNAGRNRRGQRGQNGANQQQGQPNGNQPGSARSAQANSPQNGQGQGTSPDQNQQQQAQAEGQGQGQGQGQQPQQAQAQGQGQGKGQGQQQAQAQGQGQGQGQQQTQAQAEGQGQGQGQGRSQQPAKAQAQGRGQGQGQGQGQGTALAQNQPQGQRPGQRGQGNPGGRRQRGSLTGQLQPGQSSDNPGMRNGDNDGLAGGGGENGQEKPLTGQGYQDWSDRLRDVEEMLDFPDLRNQVAGVRDRARALRRDFNSNRKPPQWSVVQVEIAKPLAEVRDRINEELARRQSKDALVPIDRDPVPQQYSELVRRYYEKLGSAEPASAPKN